MIDAGVVPPAPVNEPVLAYAPGSAERAALKAELAKQSAEVVDVPMVIGGREVRTGDRIEGRCPHAHATVVAQAHQGGPETVDAALAAARAAAPEWARMPQQARTAVFLKAAELAAGRWRARINAATMLGQSKTAHQAEIDSACELIDFWRFNAAFASRIAAEQPTSAPGIWNLAEPRPLEGFVAAITPFNFTAIAGNLPTAPALMGNVVVWKPSPLAIPSAHVVMSLLREAGLPDGVVNMIFGPAEATVGQLLAQEDLAGVHFTGSTRVFRTIWKTIGANIERYRGFPRLVGETGGKDFVFAHASADVDALAVGLVRGAFEYQGQKCSAASRAYIPRSLWPAVSERVRALVTEIRMGDVADFRTFMGAVIDRNAFARHAAALAEASSSPACTVVTGGKTDDRVGYFVEPSVIEVTDPAHRLMRDELFGPILAVWVYPDAEVDAALAAVDACPYALTGAVFARDRGFIVKAAQALRNAAGNFYVNDKPTGAVVGQQPFGGTRLSGTNDKAGSALNLQRWSAPRALKETLSPPLEIGYPSMRES
jgi:1-pyrroline-5-carboxylate dehydrogenase